jgi:hypothetical protein
MAAAQEKGMAARLAFPIAMLPYLVLVAVRFRWTPPSWAGDYAHYLLHARALAAGHRYGDIGYIYHPDAWAIGPPSYPPALPLTLLPLVKAFGLWAPALRLFAVGAVVLFAFFAFRRLKQNVGAPLAAIAAGITAFAIGSQMGDVRPMTDPPFGALLWATFLVADRDGEWTWGRTALVTLLGFAAIAFRIPGVALLPALFLFALVHRRKLGMRPFVPVFAWGGAGLIALLTGLVQNPYADGVRALRVVSSAQVQMLFYNYRYALSEATLYPAGIDGLNDAYHVLAGVVALTGLALLVWAMRRSLVAAFALAYGAMLLLAPVGDLRYSWPLVPVIGAGFGFGIVRITTILAERFGKPHLAARATVVAIVVCAIVGVGALVNKVKEPSPRTLEGDPDAEQMFSWLAGQEGARVMFHNPRVLTLRSQRPAMGLLDRTTPGQLVGIDERQITFFVWQRPEISHCAQLIANRLVDQFPARFRLAYRNATFRVYAVVQAAAPFTGAYEHIDWSQSARFCAPEALR